MSGENSKYYCPYCGSATSPNYRNCTNCGKPVENLLREKPQNEESVDEPVNKKPIFTAVLISLIALVLIGLGFLVYRNLTGPGGAHKNDVVGIWTGEIDVTESYAGSCESAEYDKIGFDPHSVYGKVVYCITVSFYSDGTYTAWVDAEKTAEASREFFENYRHDLMAAAVEYYYDLSKRENGMSRSETDKSLADQGYASMEAFAKANGVNVDSISEYDLADDLDEEECFYRISKGKILLSEQNDGFDDNMFLTYDRRGSKLEISDISRNMFGFFGGLGDKCPIELAQLPH